ncbi:SDR family NAD(P)-dependent oxidoreductase [Streptomyces minutiscleroticus]|uniref:SDR family NAD(P)-dependent oxidoreductase n=1 Tax=Streptomyces minutiscleroticus TaxID=68238 RepID=UPI00331B6879
MDRWRSEVDAREPEKVAAPFTEDAVFQGLRSYSAGRRAEGAAVVVHGRDAERANAVAESIAAAGGTAHVAIGDLSGDEGADAVTAAALADGPVDVLVNNAGTYDQVPWEDATADVWAQTGTGPVPPSAVALHELRSRCRHGREARAPPDVGRGRSSNGPTRSARAEGPRRSSEQHTLVPAAHGWQVRRCSEQAGGR